MIDATAIHAINHEAALAAAEENKVPFMVTQEDIDTYKATGDLTGLRIPTLCGRPPPSWYRVDLSKQGSQRGLDKDMNAWFVNKTSTAKEVHLREPALTLAEFCDELEAGHGYAIIEEGEFHAYVGAFKRTTKPSSRLR